MKNMKFHGTPTPFTTQNLNKLETFCTLPQKYKNKKNKEYDQSSPLPHIMYYHKRKTKNE